MIFAKFFLSSRIFFDGMFFGFLLYAFIGYYLGAATFPCNLYRQFRSYGWMISFVIAFMGTIILSRWASLREGKYDPTFFTYQSPLMVIQSVAFFMLRKEYGYILEQARWVRRSVSYLAKYSLGIYGFHAFIMDYLRFKGGFGLTSENAVLHFVALFAVTLVLSLFVSRVVALLDRKHWLV